MVGSIQSDEARHAQIGAPGARAPSSKHDRAYAQYLLDKWFWRSWLLFAVVTGFSMDYLTPLEHRTQLVQGVHARVGARSVPALARRARPRDARGTGTRSSTALDNYHHMVYASAYTLPRVGVVQLRRARARRSAPGCARSIPSTGTTSIRSGSASPSAGATADPGNDFAVHGTAIVGVLRPLPARAVRRHAARTTPRTTLEHGGQQATSSAPSRAGGSSSRSPSATPGTRTSSSACSRARRPRTWWRWCSATSGSTTTPGARTRSAATTRGMARSATSKGPPA